MRICGDRWFSARLLVFPPAELRSGDADVHVAWPRNSRAVRGRRLAELYLAVFLPDHRSGRCRRFRGDAESGGTDRALAVRLRLAVLAARSAAQSIPIDERSPAGELNAQWNAISTLSASPSSG